MTKSPQRSRPSAIATAIVAAGIAVPTLLMQGSDTWSPMPEAMDALAAVLPLASRATLHGQNHFATHTAPERWAAPLRRFLQEN